jgi:hypothetical protein
MCKDFSQDTNFCEKISERLSLQPILQKCNESPLLRKYASPPYRSEIIFAIIENRDARPPININFTNYAYASNQLNAALMRRDMIKLLFSSDFETNIALQILFAKLCRLAMNEGNILGHLKKNS